MPREKQRCLKSNWTVSRTNSMRFAMFNLICLLPVTFMFLFFIGLLSLLYIMNHDSYFQCLHQKTEAEKKLATFSSQEVSSTWSDVLVKQLQQELQHYVSLLCLLSWVSVPLDVLIVCVRLHTSIIWCVHQFQLQFKWHDHKWRGLTLLYYFYFVLGTLLFY